MRGVHRCRRRQRVAECSSGGEIDALEQSWRDFAIRYRTVVTIYGSYDTGKVRSCAGYLSSSGRRFQQLHGWCAT